MLLCCLRHGTPTLKKKKTPSTDSTKTFFIQPSQTVTVSICVNVFFWRVHFWKDQPFRLDIRGISNSVACWRMPGHNRLLAHCCSRKNWSEMGPKGWRKVWNILKADFSWQMFYIQLLSFVVWQSQPFHPRWQTWVQIICTTWNLLRLQSRSSRFLLVVYILPVCKGKKTTEYKTGQFLQNGSKQRHSYHFRVTIVKTITDMNLCNDSRRRLASQRGQLPPVDGARPPRNNLT